MPRAQDPTEVIRNKAAAFPEVVKGTSCVQSSFKTGKGAFLYVGPGAKGIGFKAMFRLQRSMSQATKLAAKEPKRFEVGSTGWVTTRFSAEAPLPKPLWEKWLTESYGLVSQAGAKGKPVTVRKTAKKKAPAAKKKATAKKATAKKAARKAATRKATSGKATTRKAATRKATTRKKTARKTTARKKTARKKSGRR